MRLAVGEEALEGEEELEHDLAVVRLVAPDVLERARERGGADQSRGVALAREHAREDDGLQHDVVLRHPHHEQLAQEPRQVHLRVCVLNHFQKDGSRASRPLESRGSSSSSSSSSSTLFEKKSRVSNPNEKKGRGDTLAKRPRRRTLPTWRRA